jgi:Restriction endonuclease
MEGLAVADEQWRKYEEVAQYLLDQFADQLGLERVEAKQKIVGLISGRQIEIDGKGVRQGNTGFVVVECKKFKDRVEAEKLEALAFRIQDVGADGGIIVTTLALQSGARKIAESQNIVTVRMSQDSTIENYVMRFFSQLMAGVSETLVLQDRADCVLVKAMPGDTDPNGES